MMTLSPRARILAIRIVTLAFSVAVSVATLTTRGAGAAPLNPPYDVYETGPLPDNALDAFSNAPGPWVSIHQERVDGRTWLLLALPDGRVATPVPGADRPRYLGRVREGERVLLSAPPETGEARLRTGRPISITPAGATVHVTSDRPSDLARETPHQFHVLERGSAPPPPRRDGPPAAMTGALERAREVRPDAGGRSVADVLALIDAVRADSLESYIRSLSEEASGQPSTRWWEDARTRGVVSDYVVGKFQEALAVAPGSSVFQHGFDVESDVTPGTTTRVYNIVGRLPAAVESRGAIMVTAHLDAIGVRSDPTVLCALGYKDDDAACDCGNAANDGDCLWSGASDPAPGADDNATGIAALLETIRILAPLEFDFDIYWVAFQAEELGLLGSAAFADSVVTGDQEIWAVLNMDMLGYNAERNQLDLVTDEG
ncbi:MAG: M28 family peptidase, partial [Gemmatimonadetes bacterium]|nr:M28 family peptidase [Gemmatimonadota bacterium]